MIIDNLKSKRNRDSMRKIYYCIWKKFNEFFIQLDSKPDSWEERPILFVGYLVENEKLQSSTVRSYISAIKAVLREDGVQLSEDKYLLSSLTKACRLQNDKVITRLPIQKPLLTLIVRTTRNHFLEINQPFLRTLYCTLFTTAYFGLFRIGELTSGTHPVLAKDIHLGSNKNNFKFLLRMFKTHWKNRRPQEIKISSITDWQQSKDAKLICPYRNLRSYLEMWKGSDCENEPFFIFSDGSPVKPEHMRNTLKQMIQLAGLDPSVYGVHSIYGGRSRDLLQARMTVCQIKKFGRWYSNAVYLYLS